MPTDLEALHELSFYSLAHRDPAFLHQLVVDTFAVQHAGESSKPISVVFALIGLYLHVEHGFTGKQVQQAHMRLARYRRVWQAPALPSARGDLSVHDVLAAPAGSERDAMIERWCASTWAACRSCRPAIAELAERELGVRASAAAATPASR
ncbi:MAG TPA: DUF5946 family protein [Terracidiphilus sp.]|nr:DUF5946 family protein [Terracidiphilus sp.]